MFNVLFTNSLLEIENIDSSDLSELLKYEPNKVTQQKASKRRNQEKLPVHSFATLLNDLGTIAKNKISINLQGGKVTFEKITQPTLLQQKALDLLGVSLMCTQSSSILKYSICLTAQVLLFCQSESSDSHSALQNVV